MSLILLRHTRPLVDTGVCYGKTDLTLALSFPKDSLEVHNRLPVVDFIISSPLLRCRQLAELLGRWRSKPVDIDDRLQEMDFGRWEGKRWDAIPRAEIDAWAADFLHARPHGGESVAMLKRRVDAVVAELRVDAQIGLLVTHAGVIKAAAAKGAHFDDFQTQVEFGGTLQLA